MSQTNQNHFQEDEEVTDEKLISFAKRVLRIQNEIKELREDVAEVKKEAKTEGIPVAEVNKAVQLLIAEMKQTPSTLSEVDELKVLLLEDVDVKSLLSQLTTKS